MKFTLLDTSAARSAEAATTTVDRRGRWWKYWEVYPILLVAAFLRLYLIQTTEFDGDQANVFRMAYDAVSHAHLVATSNIASVKIYNPPGIIYLLMLPAAINSDPIGGAILTAVLATLGVLLTYYLAVRYYGRLTAVVASLLYATAALPVFYSRFVWQQNLLLCLAPLFILVLFRGVVARRRGWFGPALFLLGLAIQLHATGLFLIAPLLMALLIAPRTVRWRDVALGCGLLFLIYAPYLLWQIATGFNDITILLHNTQGQSHIDALAFSFYQSFLSPLNEIALNPSSRLFPFVSLFRGIGFVTTALVVGGVVLACWQLLAPRSQVPTSAQSRETRLRAWWQTVCASPYRCGLAILLAWQLPLLTLLRYSIKLHPHYLIVFMPAPYLLAALFVTALATWCRHTDWRGISARVVLYGLVPLIIAAQALGSLTSVLDLASGHFVDRQMSNIYYNDLTTLQNVLREADRVAQERHLSHMYINADIATFDAFSYLARQVQTPLTIVNENCAILPATGSALMLTMPYSDLPTWLPQFATLSPVITVPRPGGPPFRLYTLSSSTQSQMARETLAPDLQWLGSRQLTVSARPSLLTSWRSLRTLPARDGTLYSYQQLSISPTTRVSPAQCTFTSLRQGERLLIRQRLSPGQRVPMAIKIQSFTTMPYTIALHLPIVSLAFDTYKMEQSPPRTLRNDAGKDTILLFQSQAD